MIRESVLRASLLHIQDDASGPGPALGSSSGSSGPGTWWLQLHATCQLQPGTCLSPWLLLPGSSSEQVLCGYGPELLPPLQPGAWGPAATAGLPARGMEVEAVAVGEAEEAECAGAGAEAVAAGGGGGVMCRGRGGGSCSKGGGGCSGRRGGGGCSDRVGGGRAL